MVDLSRKQVVHTYKDVSCPVLLCRKLATLSGLGRLLGNWNRMGKEGDNEFRHVSAREWEGHTIVPPH